MKSLFRFLRDDEAATAIEYAVMLSMILMICFLSIVLLGQHTETLWRDNHTGLRRAFK